MKTIFFIVALVLTGITARAAFQFDLKTIGNKYDMATGPYGLDYKLIVTEGAGTIYMSDILLQSPQFTVPVNVSANDYGYVNLETRALFRGDSSQFVQLDNGVTAYKLGDFKAGDEVGIWVKTDAGIGLSVFDKAASDPNFNARTVENKLIGNMQFLGADGGTVRYLVTGISGGQALPNGQPLPGVLATLLLGGGCLGGGLLRKLRRKS